MARRDGEDITSCGLGQELTSTSTQTHVKGAYGAYNDEKTLKTPVGAP